jgi:hypothetical protein
MWDTKYRDISEGVRAHHGKHGEEMGHAKEDYGDLGLCGRPPGPSHGVKVLHRAPWHGPL